MQAAAARRRQRVLLKHLGSADLAPSSLSPASSSACHGHHHQHAPSSPVVEEVPDATVAVLHPPQSAVCSDLKQFSLHLTVHLRQESLEHDARALAAALPSVLFQIVPEQEWSPHTEILTALGFSDPLWRLLRPDREVDDFVYRSRAGELGDMPATGGHVFLHAKCNVYWHLVELTKLLLESLPEESVQQVEDIYGFVYKDSRDLSGHIDGTSNPPTVEERQREVLDERGGSLLLAQRWVHKFCRSSPLRRMTDEQEERYVGRRKADSEPLEPMAETSHVRRMENFYQEGPRAGEEIQVYRQSQPYGTFGAGAGLFFMQYSNSSAVQNLLLDHMTGEKDGLRNDIMRFTTCKTSNLWYMPSKEDLRAVAMGQ